MRPKGYRTTEWLRRRAPEARGGQSKPLHAFDRSPGSLAGLVDEYLRWMQDRHYAAGSISARRLELTDFLRWADARDIRRPEPATREMLEGYQHHLAQVRKRNGHPLSIGTQRARIGSLVQLFSWLCKRHVLPANPAADLDRPRPEKRLPQESLTRSEVETLMGLPDLGDPLGLRDRAILETFYSTGLRRSELIRLELDDLNRERRTLRVRFGKGRKDRVVPIGQRALQWVEKYLEDVRPLLRLDPQQPALFLTSYGEPFSRHVLSRLVSSLFKKTGMTRPGSCHLLRHTCATHMLEGGADIRYIQQLLGHEKLETTAIYTEVSILQLQAVHARCHPAEQRFSTQDTPRRSPSEEGGCHLAEQRETPVPIPSDSGLPLAPSAP